jgi:solute carrier family 25 (mitochondrial aspartate/glutamate transporter), member 12/13
MRNILGDQKTGKIKLIDEFKAAAVSGLSQQVLTTPTEYIRIRIHSDLMFRKLYKSKTGNYPDTKPLTVKKIIEEKGIKGLYRGISMTVCRDVPFSMIFFPLYFNLKNSMMEFEGNMSKSYGYLSSWKLIFISTFSAMIAAEVVQVIYFTLIFNFSHLMF